MIKEFYFKQFCFALSTQFISIKTKNMTLSGVTTSVESGPGSDDNKEFLCIP